MIYYSKSSHHVFLYFLILATIYHSSWAFLSSSSSKIPSSTTPIQNSATVVSFRPTTTNVPKSTALQATVTAKATLNEDTTWKISFICNGIPTKKGNTVDQIFVINAQFIEEMGYEPPQGEMRQIIKNDNDDDNNASLLQITKATWKLSEDPEDRKDGLWIWGLFAEPLYPFMLLQIETDAFVLQSDKDDAVQPLKLYAQLTHTRDKEIGVVLTGGVLNSREMETYKLDPFGASSIDLFENVPIGQINLQPTTTTTTSN